MSGMFFSDTSASGQIKIGSWYYTDGRGACITDLNESWNAIKQ